MTDSSHTWMSDYILQKTEAGKDTYYLSLVLRFDIPVFASLDIPRWRLLPLLSLVTCRLCLNSDTEDLSPMVRFLDGKMKSAAHYGVL